MRHAWLGRWRYRLDIVRLEEYSSRRGGMIKDVMSIVSRLNVVGDEYLGSLHELGSAGRREADDSSAKTTRERMTWTRMEGEGKN